MKVARFTAVKSLKKYYESFLNSSGKDLPMKPFVPTVAMAISKNYDACYYSSGQDWLPGRAEMEIALGNGEPGGGDQFRAFEISLKSGPAALYRYLPFSAFIYVDDRAAAVLEFARPQETQTATLEVPASRPFRLTIVSELSQRLPKTQPEPRDRALILVDMRPGSITPVHVDRVPAVRPRRDHFSHQRVALVDELPQPVFVVGPYRSGTSILTWALGQHPNIWPLPETLWVPHLGTGAVAGYWIGSRPPRNYFNLCDVTMEEYLAHVGCSIDDFIKRTTLRRMNRMQFERLHPRPGTDPHANNAFELARTLFGRKRRWVDGTPENAGNMSLLGRLFPAARFICTVRDPVDVIASMLHFDQAGGNSAEIHDAADMWLRMTNWTLQAGKAFGSQKARFVSYKELTDEPLKATSTIFDFLDEPRAPKAADAYAHRINSSKLSPQDRDRVRPEIMQYIAKTEIPRIYDEVCALIGASWPANAAALKELDSRHDAVVMATLKATLPDVPIEIP